MMEAPIPKNEAARLEALKKLKLLDTPPEERFDRITRIATQIFGMPISTVTMVDENREWFKSVCGLPKKEGGRAVSFCGHTVLEDDILVIPDAKLDPRFADNPMVVGKPFIRAYAGVPLKSVDGQNVGAFCVKGHEPRAFTEAEKDALRGLAKWAELEMNQHELYNELVELREATKEMQTVFDTSDDLIGVADLDGYFKRVNPAFERVLGYAAAEILRTPFMSFIHPEDIEATKAQMGRFAEGKKVIDFTVRFRKKDGSDVWLQWNATPIGPRLYAVARDITQLRERERELARLNMLMVDRELKMIELKERIKALEAR